MIKTIPASLPLVAKLMVELVGYTKTLNIISEFGGSRIFFPDRGFNANHPIRAILTESECDCLCKNFLGSVNVPRAKSLTASVRNEQIWVDRLSGLTLRQLSKKYQLCERQISYSFTSHEQIVRKLSNSPARLSVSKIKATTHE